MRHHVQYFYPKKMFDKMRETLKLTIFSSFLLPFLTQKFAVNYVRISRQFQGDVKGFNEGTKSTVTLIKLPAQQQSLLLHFRVQRTLAVNLRSPFFKSRRCFFCKFFNPENKVKNFTFQKCGKIINRISEFNKILSIDIVVLLPLLCVHMLALSGRWGKIYNLMR